ncbi:MAG: nucleotide disphospho-sugar-binding domain-containing protein, partial [Terracoccus sp.]
VRDTFTTEWNDALRTLDPTAPSSEDAFAETGDVLLLNYPAELHPAARTALLPPHAFLGSAVREEAPDDQVERWLAADDRPIVYVSLGSFLSVRSDVLSRVVDALRRLEVRVALASGSSPRSKLGRVPTGWLVRPELPQVRLLQQAVLAVSHGGNNSVTEALTAGVPLVLLPLSTDQFAGAAALEQAGFGEALDPNVATSSEIRATAGRLLALAGDPRQRLEALGASLRDRPGAERALEAIAASTSVA